MEELAWSDETLQLVVDQVGDTSIRELRDDVLQLSQPADGGWYFWADHQDSQRAEQIASAWANVFVEQVHASIVISGDLERERAEINAIILEDTSLSADETQRLIDRISPLLTKTKGLSMYVEAYVSQGEQLQVTRTIDLSYYVIVGAVIGAFGLALVTLFMLRPKDLLDE